MFCAKCGTTLREGTAFCSVCGAPVAAAEQPAPSPSTPLPPAPGPYTPLPPLPTSYAPLPPALPVSAGPGGYATWADRAIGYVIDSLFVVGAMLLLYAVLGGFFSSLAAMGGESSSAAAGMCCLAIVIFPVATILVGIYNRVMLVSQRGYSIGQGVMKLKVIDANGQLLTQANALIRLLAQVALGFIPFVGMLDLLWPLWDDNRQTLHDKAVGSFVIYNRDVR